MDNSIYVTLSRQLALFQDMDVTANNIANANTSGYTAEHILFSSYMSKDINQGNSNQMAMTNGYGSYRNTENGPLTQTNNPLDVALSGPGYFAVETPLGIRYTRAGAFTINGDGTLVTPEGYPVLDNANGHIEFPEDTDTVDVGTAGNIKVNGTDFAAIGVFQFPNDQMLERQGNKLFSSDVAPQPADDSVRVIQGTIEGSNVSPVLEMTHMINVSRSVTDTAQFVSAIYDLESKTADAWAQQTSS